MEPNASAADPLSAAGVSFATRYTLGTILCVGCTWGSLANGGVLTVFYHKRSYNYTNINYVIVLSIINIVVSLITIPTVGVSYFLGKWVAGNSGCVFYAFVATAGGLLSMVILMFLTLNKFISFVYTDRDVSDLLLPSVMTISVLVTLFMSVAPLLGMNTYSKSEGGLHCAVDWRGDRMLDQIHTGILIALYYFVPVIFFVFAFIKILLKRENNQGSNEQDRLVRNFHAVTLAFVGIFMLSWTPYVIYSINVITYGYGNVHPLFSMIAAVIAKVTCAWYPIIYYRLCPEFNKAVKDIFPSLRSRQIEDVTMSRQHNPSVCVHNSGASGIHFITL